MHNNHQKVRYKVILTISDHQYIDLAGYTMRLVVKVEYMTSSSELFSDVIGNLYAYFLLISTDVCCDVFVFTSQICRWFDCVPKSSDYWTHRFGGYYKYNFWQKINFQNETVLISKLPSKINRQELSSHEVINLRNTWVNS